MLEFSNWLVDVDILLVLQQVELNTVTSPPPAPQFKRLKFYHQPVQKKKNKIIVVSTAVLRSRGSRN